MERQQRSEAETPTKNGNCEFCSEPILDAEPFVEVTTRKRTFRHHLLCRSDRGRGKTFRVYVRCVRVERFDVSARNKNDALRAYKRGNATLEADEVESREVLSVERGPR
jgi:hypothetical protein